MVSDLVDGLAGQPVRELATGFLDDQRGQSGRALLTRLGVVGAAQQLDEVGGLGVADPPLAAGDDVGVAVELGAGADGRQVGSGVGLGEAGRTDPVAAGRAFQQGAPLGAVAEVGAQPLRPRDDAGDAHPAAGQFLGHQAVLEHAQAHAAELRGHHDAEVALLAHGLDQRAGHLTLLRIQDVRHGLDVRSGELPRRVLQGDALVGPVGRRHDRVGSGSRFGGHAHGLTRGRGPRTRWCRRRGRRPGPSAPAPRSAPAAAGRAPWPRSRRAAPCRPGCPACAAR